MAIGFTCAIITGLGLPSFVFLFGNIVNSFGADTEDDFMAPFERIAI